MDRTTSLLLVSLVLTAPTVAEPLAAQVAQPAQAPRSPACSGPEHRQFDFWIGDWDVTLPNGRAAGTNRIRQIHRGCALREEWRGASGSTGTSLNTYDSSTRRWHQTWVDDGGMLLQLDGGMRDGSMELSGSTVGANGIRTVHRIRWTPLAGTPGRLRQLWESSTDGGRSWTIVFDGIYRRRG